MKSLSLISALRRYKSESTPIIGCFPLYPPVELFTAMGFAPVVLWNLKKNITGLADSDRHVQSYACGIVRELVQFIISEGEFLSGIFFYNACDTLRNTPEILTVANEALGRSTPMFRIHLPQVNRSVCDPGIYFENEIRRLLSSLEHEFGLTFSPEAFFQATKAYAEMRGLCIAAEQGVASGEIPFGAFSHAVLAGYYLPVEQQIDKLKALIARKWASPSQNKEKRVILSGIMPPPPTVIKAMENAGLRVVGNDIASLRRSYGYSPEPAEDPATYYLDMFSRRFPCTTLLYTADNRVDTLLSMAEQTKADGMIFIGEKFCEHEYFEFPYMEKRLQEKGVSTLTLEFSVDDADNVDSYLTRVEAFSELLA
ncbi:MAG: 2-hydroxyacyl-CoA dehydratase family protein [Desulfobacterium sp.]